MLAYVMSHALKMVSPPDKSSTMPKTIGPMDAPAKPIREYIDMVRPLWTGFDTLITPPEIAAESAAMDMLNNMAKTTPTQRASPAVNTNAILMSAEETATRAISF